MNGKIKDIIESLVIIILCVIAVNIMFEKGYISSGSMEPTLMTGDKVLYIRSITPVKRGEIIAFDKDGENVCKRVIGIPGDVISFNGDGYVYVNGNKVSEPYLKDSGATYKGIQSSYTVPEKSVFVMGDNRLDSYDSRYWDSPFVKYSDIHWKFLKVVAKSVSAN